LKHCFIWLRDLDTKKTGASIFGGPRNVMLEENREDKIVRESDYNEQVLEFIEEKRTLLNNILRRKAN
jgi:hypothetical protein